MEAKDVHHLMHLLGVRLNRAGTATSPGADRSWVSGYCPFAPWKHARGSDSRASFGVLVNNDGVSTYHCFSCKSKGTAVSLIAELAKLNSTPINIDELYFSEYSIGAHNKFFDIAKWAIELELNGSTAIRDMWDTQAIDESDGAKHIKPFTEDRFINFTPCYSHTYLSDRRINEQTAEVLGLRYDSYRHRIVFPIHDSKGRFVGCSGRAVLPGIEPKIYEYPGFKKKLYFLGESRLTLKAPAPIVLVEGPFDYAKVYQAIHGADAGRYQADVLALLGAALSHEKAARLIALKRPIIPLLDNDEAGLACLWGSKDALTGAYKGRGLVSVLSGFLPVLLPGDYPSGKNDPGDLDDVSILRMLDEARYVYPGNPLSDVDIVDAW